MRWGDPIMMQIVTNDHGEMYPYAEDEITQKGHTFRVCRDFLTLEEQKELIRWFMENRFELVYEEMREILGRR